MALTREINPIEWMPKKETLEQMGINDSELFKLIEGRFLRVAIHNGQLFVSRQSIREYEKERGNKPNLSAPVQKTIPIEPPPEQEQKKPISFHEKIFIKCTEYAPNEFGYEIGNAAIAFRKPVSTILTFVEKNRVEIVHVGDVHYLKRGSFRAALEKNKHIIPEEGKPSSFLISN